MPLSKLAPATILSTAAPRSMPRSMITGNIARADAERGLARAIGRLDHRPAAGGDDDIDTFHQLLGLGDRAIAHHLNEIVRASVCLDDCHEGVGQMLGAALRLGVGGEDHGVAGLQREHAVAHRCDHRIGDRRHRADHAHRLGDIDQLALRILIDDPAALLALQAVPDRPGLALLLGDLVLIIADAGLLDRHAGEQFGIIIDIFADVADDAIDLLLAECLEYGLSIPRLGDQFGDFGIERNGILGGTHRKILLREFLDMGTQARPSKCWFRHSMRWRGGKDQN